MLIIIAEFLPVPPARELPAQIVGVPALIAGVVLTASHGDPRRLLPARRSISATR